VSPDGSRANDFSTRNRVYGSLPRVRVSRRIATHANAAGLSPRTAALNQRERIRWQTARRLHLGGGVGAPGASVMSRCQCDERAIFWSPRRHLPKPAGDWIINAVARSSGPCNALATGGGEVWHSNREEAFNLFQATTWDWVVLFVLLMGAGWLILRIRARFRDREDPAVEGRRMIMQMGDLHRQGGLSDEEYRSIKSRLGGPRDHALRAPKPETDHGVNTDSH
jgi:hypothetical protein